MRTVGHMQGGVALAAVTQSGAFAVTGANHDSALAVFSLAVKASGKLRTRKAKCHIQLEHQAKQLICSDTVDGGSAFLVVAVTDAGAVEVWECDMAATPVEPTQRCKVHVAGGSSASAQGIFAASLDGSHCAPVPPPASSHALSLNSASDMRLRQRVASRNLVLFLSVDGKCLIKIAVPSCSLLHF